VVRKIVFIVSQPLYLRDYRRYGTEILIKNGFEVEFFNITPYVYPVLYSNATKKNLYKGERQKILNGQRAALKAINNICNDSFVVLLFNYNHNTYHVFRAITKARLAYAVSVLSNVPTLASDSGKKKLFGKLKKLKSINFQKIINRLYSPLYSKYMGIAAPNALLMGGEMCMSHPLFSLSDTSTEILWLHTYDYDNYLQCQDSQYQSGLKSAVFIDAPSPRFKFDALIPGISSPLTEAKYYPALCKFFDCIESEYNVDVEIAAHPKSDHDPRPDYFGKRLVHNNRTISMIRDSTIVINRNSTSINFSVLYKKPVIFHTSDEIETSLVMTNQIKSMALALGKAPVNIDHLSNIDWNNQIKIDKQAYSQYKNSYIKKDNTDDLPIWQSFANWLKLKY